MQCHKLPNTLDSCECTEAEYAKIPDITFKVEDDTYLIKREQWVERGQGQCVIKFMHGPTSEYWILGLNFFLNYYAVFDYENERLGFAESIVMNKKKSSHFIDWAIGKSDDSLMNLMSAFN